MKYILTTEILKVTGADLFRWDAERISEYRAEELVEYWYSDEYGDSHVPYLDSERLDDAYSNAIESINIDLESELEYVAKVMNEEFRKICDKYAADYLEKSLKDREDFNKLEIIQEDTTVFTINSDKEISKELIDDCFDYFIIDELLNTYQNECGGEFDLDLPESGIDITYEPDIDWYQDEMQLIPDSFKEINE